MGQSMAKFRSWVSLWLDVNVVVAGSVYTWLSGDVCDALGVSLACSVYLRLSRCFCGCGGFLHIFETKCVVVQTTTRIRPAAMRGMSLSELVALRDEHRPWLETAEYNSFAKKDQRKTM